MEIIYILWLRQIKRYYRSKARIIGSLGQPLLFMIAFGFGFGPIYQKAGGGNYLQFLVPGVIAMSILFSAVFSGLEIIWDRQFGFLKEMLVAPVPRLKIMFGRCLGGATVAVLQGVIVFLLSLLVGFRVDNWLLMPAALGFMFLIALVFTLFGTGIASSMKDVQGFQLIINFLVMPLFFLSGAFFPLTGLPSALKAVMLVNPLSYGVDALRNTLVGLHQLGLVRDFTILSVVVIIFLVVASYLFSKIEA
ncbi:MAG: ABC transporter permease [Candidatus Falkowbacteria bacterium]|nr:ABC transporter permease [Candidatus Falkowbacteria bacterium]